MPCLSVERLLEIQMFQSLSSLDLALVLDGMTAVNGPLSMAVGLVESTPAAGEIQWAKWRLAADLVRSHRSSEQKKQRAASCRSDIARRQNGRVDRAFS